MTQKVSSKSTPRVYGRSASMRAIQVLVRREWLKVFKEPSRALGIIIQPLLFWWVIGSGFVPSFRSQQMADVDYQTYFFPGVLALVLLFSSIFSMITLIDDRNSGFMQAVLVSPCSRSAVVFGKILGAFTIASVQLLLFMPLLPLAGISFVDVFWPAFFIFAVLGALFFTSLGFLMAWLSPSSSAFHALMSIFLIPMWILSGAMFPLENTWMSVCALINPAAWLVQGFQYALLGSHLNVVSIFPSMIKLLSLTVLTTGLGVYACYRNR
jgi:ABC-2 type transport system permease protein